MPKSLGSLDEFWSRDRASWPTKKGLDTVNWQSYQTNASKHHEQQPACTGSWAIVRPSCVKRWYHITALIAMRYLPFGNAPRSTPHSLHCAVLIYMDSKTLEVSRGRWRGLMVLQSGKKGCHSWALGIDLVPIVEMPYWKLVAPPFRCKIRYEYHARSLTAQVYACNADHKNIHYQND